MLGSAIVDAVEEAGGIAIATTRSPGKIAALNQEAEQHQKTRRFAQLDFADEAALKAGVAEIVSDYGPVTGLVNNAYAALPFKSVEETGWEHWNAAMSVSVAASSSLAVALAREQALESVVNISSMYGIVAPRFAMYPEGMEPNPLVYGPSKAAMLALTRYLAAYWGERGIRVNAVSPGGVANRQNETFLSRYNETVPMQRMVSPQEVAQAVCFLLSRGAGGITGENLVVDAGRTIW